MNNKPSYIELEKQNEELNKTSNKRLEQLLKNSFDMIVLLDSNGIQHYVSESCEKILGYRPDELIRIPVIEQLIHPEDQEKVSLAFQDIVKNSINGGTQYRHRHKNGGWVYLEAVGSNQIDNPLIQSVILNVRDITERKNAEAALIESKARLSELNATKDRFFSIIAHDLKSPFNSIFGFCELLVEQLARKDYQGVEKFAAIINRSSKQAMDLLTNLLEWARAQTGKIEFNPEYIELVTLVNDVAELFDDSAQQKSITILKDLPHNIPVFADKYMVDTILRNLIANGIKFTHPRGKIRIHTEQNENQLTVSVADNGIGIEKEAIDKLFQIEYSYSTTGTARESGTGLGLLLCKEFIEMHGGKIWVESKPGKGSTFRFTLPAI
ncbi:PAS domain-containing sensor histidine kinase [Prolixibacter denitrificans]|uniref:histidine kinase n=1 Tax=Prolixibacter denitrificans TaxID=1541063 RepID=A0A2P8C708_9BACT|nr:PAS domain-containing sensor histidine kinase [Prolixibacter denitrificans]PSK80741.1 PAS domain S-box-containing protein [Prolixibacter denitrificans]GET22460.1 hypothetical protein JCM18694_27060 [Prolixibacter denitrificans]